MSGDTGVGDERWGGMSPGHARLVCVVVKEAWILVCQSANGGVGHVALWKASQLMIYVLGVDWFHNNIIYPIYFAHLIHYNDV